MRRTTGSTERTALRAEEDARKHAEMVRVLDTVRERLPSLLRATVVLEHEESEESEVAPFDLDALPLGGSRVGGLPDLPPALSWPTYEGHSLALALQVNLADVVAAPVRPSTAETMPTGRDDVGVLPKRGWLWLFMELDRAKYWDAPGGSRLLYWDGPVQQLQRRRHPGDTSTSDPALFGALLAAHPLHMSRTVTMVDCLSNQEGAGFTPQQLDAIGDLRRLAELSTVPDDEDVFDLGAVYPCFQACVHNSYKWQMLGYPENIQGPFLDGKTLLMQLRSNGVRYFPGKGASTVGQLSRPTHFQMGDVGNLHVLIDPTDLAAHRFDKVEYYAEC